MRPARHPAATAAWPEGRTYRLRGRTVHISAPVCIARSAGYLWFPTLARTAGGDLLATMSNYADVHTSQSTSFRAWSTDGGRTWGELIEAPYGDVHLVLPSGDDAFLPYYLYPRPGGMGAPFVRVASGGHTLEVVEPGVLVVGWPKPDQPIADTGARGFVFNGQCVALRGGGYLATLYGTYAGDRRYTLVGASSSDGITWEIRGEIAGPGCPLPGSEGPCEAALCRLRDGRLMCVFRVGSGSQYGQAFSPDEGRTWSTARGMDNAFSVQPSLAVLGEGGLVLSGGRPSPFLWFNPAGDGAEWLRISLEEHHNALCEGDAMRLPNTSSCYTEVVAIDERTVLCIYDRIPYGWAPIPPRVAETNSVWIVRATLGDSLGVPAAF